MSSEGTVSPGLNSYTSVIVVGLLLAVVPLVVNGYSLSIATTTLLIAGLTLAWNIIGGIGRQFSFAHSLFIACGAFLPAALYLEFGVSPWIGMVLGALAAAALGIAISWISFRFDLPNLTFALITLAFAEVGLLYVLNTPFLGASDGLSIKRPAGAGPADFAFDAYGSYFLALSAVVLTLLLVRWIQTSRLGYYLRMIHIDDRSARAMGINTLQYKTTGMAISAVVSSVFGTMYAQYMIYIDPHSFASPILVIQIILFASIGGLGTLWGPVLAAGFLVPLGEYVRGAIGGTASGMHFVIYGIIIVVMILFMPDGIVGGLKRLGHLVRRKRSDTPASPAGAGSKF